jgi:dihydrofolate reductase
LRRVVSYLIYSLNGVVGNPLDWVFDRFNHEMVENLAKLIGRQDTVLFGRRTYDEFQNYWPASTNEPFASFINDTAKYVASSTLTEVTWRNSTLIKGDILTEVAEMKRADGRDIGVHGSPTLARSLLDGGLLDELNLAVFPVLSDEKNPRLFQGYERTRKLTLTAAQQTHTGVMFLTYRPQ